MLSSTCMASTFSWWWSLSSCSCVNLWILLDTTSTSRSLWRSLFLMYQGALTMFWSTLFWNRIMSILLCLVQPQSWIPYVQTGFSICLYSLLWRDSEEFLPISQYLFVYLSPSSSHLFLTWVFHRSLVSRVMPRCLAVLAYGTFWMLIVTGMCSKRLLVKLRWTDLDSLSWMCCFFLNFFFWLMAVCNFAVDSSLLLPTANIAVSSAKVATMLFYNFGRSLVYSRYRTGPNTLPCGTSGFISLSSE